MQSSTSSLSSLRKWVHSLVVAAIVLGILPPPMVATLVNATLPEALAEPVTEGALSLLPPVRSAQAESLQAPLAASGDRDVQVASSHPVAKGIGAPMWAPSDAPLTQIVTPGAVTGSLILTKTVLGSSRNNYTVTLTGPSYPAGQDFAIATGTNTVTNVIPGVYIVTELSPGTG